MTPMRLVFLLLIAPMAGSVSAALPSKLELIPDACAYLTEGVARVTLGGEIRPMVSNEHIPHFYSQCEYVATGGRNAAVRFLFKFMVKEMFDVEKLAPAQVDFNAGFAEGGLTHAEKLQFPGELTYVFHERDTTKILTITEIDGPKDGVMQDSILILSYRLIDGDRTPKQRRDILMKFPWQLLADLNK